MPLGGGSGVGGSFVANGAGVEVGPRAMVFVFVISEVYSPCFNDTPGIAVGNSERVALAGSHAVAPINRMNPNNRLDLNSERFA
ncbi:hypothetical protein ANRL3_02014 [Anaerolineae bacterium]|nr:hypothetical protein ANRL3_02014 [Anaerolineae bacterium]